MTTKYYLIKPPEKLKDYVRTFWVLERHSLDKPYIHRTVADCYAELLFHYKGCFDELISDNQAERSFTSGIHATSQIFRRFLINESFGIFGVSLYPFTIPLLLSTSPVELVDKMPDLPTLLGRIGKELEEKMMLAPNNTARYKIISSFLENRLFKLDGQNHPIVAAIRHVTHLQEPHNVRDLANLYNLSLRQFERKFKEYAGFSPKLYARIVRFQNALRKYGSGHCHTLTEIAYECGYYDQSHFIQDFKAFSGYHPKQYFSGKALEATEYLDV